LAVTVEAVLKPAALPPIVPTETSYIVGQAGEVVGRFTAADLSPLVGGVPADGGVTPAKLSFTAYHGHRPGDASVNPWYLHSHGARVYYDVVTSAGRVVRLSNVVAPGPAAAVPTGAVMEVWRDGSGGFAVAVQNHDGAAINTVGAWRRRAYRFDGADWAEVGRTGDLIAANALSEIVTFGLAATALANLGGAQAANSVAATGGLVGDVADPGPNMRYGTDGTGARGWVPDIVGAGGTPGFTDVTGTTRTLAAGDDGARLRFTNAAGCTVTVPNSLPVGWTVMLYEGAAGGTVTIVFGSGAAVLSSAAQSGSLTSTGDGDSAALECLGNVGGSAARFSVTGFGAPGGGGGTWGSITGTLSAQTDLQAALDARLAKASNLADLTDRAAARDSLRVSHGTQTLTSGTAVTWDTRHPLDGGKGRVPLLTLAHNATLSMTNLVAGDSLELTVTQDGTGGRTFDLDGTTCGWLIGDQGAAPGAGAHSVYSVKVIGNKAFFVRWGAGATAP
jgi:hypothetical protein